MVGGLFHSLSFPSEKYFAYRSQSFIYFVPQEILETFSKKSSCHTVWYSHLTTDQTNSASLCKFYVIFLRNIVDCIFCRAGEQCGNRGGHWWLLRHHRGCAWTWAFVCSANIFLFLMPFPICPDLGLCMTGLLLRPTSGVQGRWSAAGRTGSSWATWGTPARASSGPFALSDSFNIF